MADEMDDGVAAFLADLPQIREDGAAALRRLLALAQADNAQSPRAAAFLLSFYDSQRFGFELETLLEFDEAAVADCMLVMKMQLLPEKPVSDYFVEGPVLFEKLALQWHLGTRWGHA